MTPSVTLSVSIARDWREIYAAFHEPEAFARWASGLSTAHLRRDGNAWVGEGAEGPIRVRFTPKNAYGVMDHWVDIGGGATVHVPMRILQNGDGAEVTLTLYRQVGMDDAKFAEDQAWVQRDLEMLKTLAETG